MESQTISPLIMDIFAESRRKLGITRKPELRLSDELEYCAGRAYRKFDSGKGLILIDAYIEEYLDEDGIRYLIGHELGHLVRWNKYLNKDILEYCSSPDDGRKCPDTLARKLFHLIGEITADLYGVKACGSIDVAADTKDILLTGLELKRRFYDTNDTAMELPLVEWGAAIQMRALKLLRQSVLYSDLAESQSFDYGKGLMSYYEYWDAVFEYFPALEYGFEADNAIGDCLASVLWILKADSSAGMSTGTSSYGGIERNLWMHDRKLEPSDFSSKQEAFGLLDEASSRIVGLKHPFKNDAFQSIVKDTYKMEDDQDVADDFLFDVGVRMGFAPDEIITFREFCG